MVVVKLPTIPKGSRVMLSLVVSPDFISETPVRNKAGGESIANSPSISNTSLPKMSISS